MVFLATAVVIVYSIILTVNVQALVIKFLHLVSESHNHSKTMAFVPCAEEYCVTVHIEDDLRVTRSQRVRITLSSNDDRITLQQTTGDMEIIRIPGMCDNKNNRSFLLQVC